MGLFSFLGGKAPEEIEMSGDAYVRIEEFGAAKIEYEKALQKAQKKCPEKSNLISRLSEKITQANEALAASHLKNAQALIFSENFDEAEGLLHLVLELSNDERVKEKALADLEAMRKNSKTPVFHDHEAVEPMAAHMDHGDDEKNIDDYFLLLCSTLPEDVQQEYHRYGQAFKTGYVALNRGDFEKAAVDLETAMREHPIPHTQIPVELATALVHLNRSDEAVGILEKYIEETPDSLRGYQALCEVYWDAGEYESAVDLLIACPDELKAGLPVRMLLGETFYQSGKYAEALNVFEKAMDAFGFNEMIARSLAKSHEAAGNIQQAKTLYGQIMTACRSCQTRTDPFIKGRYAELCFQSGEKSDRLLEVYFSLAQEDPDNKHQYYQRIHQIYEHMGNVDQARRYRLMADSPRRRP